MGEIADMAGKWLDRRLPGAMEALGIKAASLVSASLDEAYPPASKPGESPHKRTGNLRAGVDYTSDADSTVISSSRAEGDPAVPKYLEFGTSKMEARPYMRPVQNRAETYVPAVMRRSLSGEATYAEAG